MDLEHKELEFFREVSRRISGHLDMSRALVSFLQYVSSAMPADRCTLQVMHGVLAREKESMEIIYDADKNGIRNESIRIEISEHLKKIKRVFLEKGLLQYDEDGIGILSPVDEEKSVEEIGEEYQLGSEIVAYLKTMEGPYRYLKKADNIKEASETAGVAKALNLPGSPGLILTLGVGDAIFGSLMITNYSGNSYTDDHMLLLISVRQIISISVLNHLRFRKMKELKDILADENRFLHDELDHHRDITIVGADFGLKRTMEMVHHVARQESPVLLLGETGVGKEIIASAIHHSSPRVKGPFIKVNCGAIPDTLIDSELFGHEKGAFTGALGLKRGRFERADKGTIFLDEVGELPLEVQVRLLRVLQEREIDRVGGVESISIDIRIVAATNRDLEKMVEQGGFREDLFFRLNVFPIEIPPLRDRKIDIPALTHYILTEKAREMKLSYMPTLGVGAIEQLVNYSWPGNVRELENTIERAIIIYGESPIYFDHFESRTVPEDRSKQGTSTDTVLKYDQVVRRHIEKVLDMTAGKVHGNGGAAEVLDVNPSTLRKRMRKLGIRFGRK